MYKRYFYGFVSTTNEQKMMRVRAYRELAIDDFQC